MFLKKELKSYDLDEIIKYLDDKNYDMVYIYQNISPDKYFDISKKSKFKIKCCGHTTKNGWVTVYYKWVWDDSYVLSKIGI